MPKMTVHPSVFQFGSCLSPLSKTLPKNRIDNCVFSENAVI